jgi:hypothetical protein
MYDYIQMQSPLPNQQQNDSNNGDETNPINNELQATTSSPSIVIEPTEINEPLVGGNSSENNESEQQIVHD